MPADISQLVYERVVSTYPPTITTPAEPVFNREESTVQEFPPTSPIRFIYQCQATGVPPPLIRWNARNQMSGRREPITDNTARISITTFPPVLNEVSSTLTINQGADFNMPRCIAENSAGTIQLRADEFLVPGGSVTPGTGVCSKTYVVQMCQFWGLTHFIFMEPHYSGTFNKGHFE